MQAVLREYSGQGAAELIDFIAAQGPAIRTLMGSVKGFVSYAIIRTAEGGYTVTICQDQAGIDESVQKARDWIAKNAAHIKASAPKVTAGKLAYRF